ncbi:ABC transporter permease [Alkaliphilus peptidifermentans]|uniref:Peptide/nickel transport system permease protein n=1 Tax=Alkaliphilus peptidifermentans DSM 18978 TaxID=1120976 RepID=A0A1G5JM55_9FIRM|nr:ABC transporter permease [Alkaliphilus peptidifermentans]SCY88970.1 peptide/nickel transport system permease protein [Alkaliphilus peptidifermentans DSM 18978]
MNSSKLKYLTLKVANNLLLMVMLILLSFALPRLIPGSPIAGFEEDIHILNTILPEETFNRFSEYYAPSEPLSKQLLIYLQNIINFDLGYSFYYGYPVLEVIKGRIGWTLLLSIMSILFSSLIAIPAGLYSAMKSNKTDRVLTFSIITLQAIPVFIIALIIQRIFAYRLGLFPSQGAYSIKIYSTTVSFFVDAGYHLILPLAASVISQIPSSFILMRNIVFRIKNEPYVEMAYFNNIDEISIGYFYIFKNCLPEIISKLNIHFMYAIAGTLFVEMIFSYPGIGYLLRVAVSARDYPLIQGIFLVIIVYAIAINILFEWILCQVSPRVSQ